MAVTKIQLNGTVFTVGTVEETQERIGDVIQAANGARRFAYRALKRRWSIKWPAATLAELVNIRAIAALTTTFTYQDENGATYTALCLDSPLKSSPTILAYASGAQVLYYDVTLDIVEA